MTPFLKNISYILILILILISCSSSIIKINKNSKSKPSQQPWHDSKQVLWPRVNERHPIKTGADNYPIPTPLQEK
jgi:hypothetical protein